MSGRGWDCGAITLKIQKKCPAEYVGSELSLKRGRTSLRADMFGVSNKGEKPSIYVKAKGPILLKLDIPM
jgi:hypothetical protein